MHLCFTWFSIPGWTEENEPLLSTYCDLDILLSAVCCMCFSAVNTPFNTGR